MLARPRDSLKIPSLACIIHKYSRALAGSFARNESLVPQGAFFASSGIHLVGRP